MQVIFKRCYFFPEPLLNTDRPTLLFKDRHEQTGPTKKSEPKPPGVGPFDFPGNGQYKVERYDAVRKEVEGKLCGPDRNYVTSVFSELEAHSQRLHSS